MTPAEIQTRKRRSAALAALVGLALVAFAAGAALGGSGEEAVVSAPAPVGVEGASAICPPPSRGLITRGPDGDRAVALTFDDGPGPQTRSVLRALRRHDARATFFFLGREIPTRPAMLRRAVRDGHELGNHSTSHDELPEATDIGATSELIERVSGERPCVFRPPDGRTSGRVLRDARGLGMSTVTWSVDPADWASQDPAGIRDRVLAAAEPGAIILMHDGGGDRTGTARAVSSVIDGLRDRGYRLVTVSELLDKSG